MRKDVIRKVDKYYKEKQESYKELRKTALVKAKGDEHIMALAHRIQEIKLLTLQGKASKSLDKEYDSLVQEFTTLINPYMADITYECPLCKDTGRVNGKYCSCYMNRYMTELKKMSNLNSNTRFNFSDNNISNYNIDETKLKRYNSLFKKLETFANQYPDSIKKNIIMSGGVGTGKTSLVSAVANRLIERNIPTYYVSAFELSEMMLSAHIENRQDILPMLYDVDVLIIDDLGTEPIRNNINKEYLQAIIDIRLANDKSTIITTNFNMEQLMSKYGERIVSRLYINSMYFDLFDMPNLRMTARNNTSQKN